MRGVAHGPVDVTFVVGEEVGMEWNHVGIMFPVSLPT